MSSKCEKIVSSYDKESRNVFLEFEKRLQEVTQRINEIKSTDLYKEYRQLIGKKRVIEDRLDEIDGADLFREYAQLKQDLELLSHWKDLEWAPIAPFESFRSYLSVRTCNALKAAGIHNLLQLAKLTNDKLLSIKGLGKKGLAEIDELFTVIRHRQ